MNNSVRKVGVVILTQGTRPDELHAAVESVLKQRDVETDVVVVGNGWDPDGLPKAVRGVFLDSNRGISAGRNAGVDHVVGDTLLFLDDDARLESATFLHDALNFLNARPQIALLHPQVKALDGVAPQRWIPRIRKGDPSRPSPAFVLWEGGTVVRRAAFDAAGRWPDDFTYAHEGIDLIWRIWATGAEAWYRPELVVLHPAIHPTRHLDYYNLNARHRVWIARRNLPWPLVVPYVLSWTAIQVVRSIGSSSGRASLRSWFAGWFEGWRSPVERNPMSWKTVLRMTVRGRPPII